MGLSPVYRHTSMSRERRINLTVTDGVIIMCLSLSEGPRCSCACEYRVLHSCLGKEAKKREDPLKMSEKSHAGKVNELVISARVSTYCKVS